MPAETVRVTVDPRIVRELARRGVRLSDPGVKVISRTRVEITGG